MGNAMRVVVFTLALIVSFGAQAADIASCSNPEGRAYFPELGLVGEKDRGWSNDKITGGLTKLVKLSEGAYDVLFVDATKDIISARGDGATIIPLNRGQGVFSVLVIYPGKTAETYTFLRDKSGRLEYLQTTSRAGDGVPIAKVSVMRGTCSYINFGAL
jgi:hypothetical protein